MTHRVRHKLGLHAGTTLSLGDLDPKAADELDARVRATLMTQSARDDAAQLLGYAAHH